MRPTSGAAAQAPSPLSDPDKRAEAQLERRRQRNRESMRRVRMRKRESRQGAQQTVERLQRQLQSLVASNRRRAEEMLSGDALTTEASAPSPPPAVSAAYADVLAQTAALSVANQRLRAQVHEFQEAEAAVARMLSDDSERPRRRLLADGNSSSGMAAAAAGDELEDDDSDNEAEREAGISLRPLLSWLLLDGQLDALVQLATRKILENAELARSLVPRGNVALGWHDRRCVDAGSVARYHLQKRFTQHDARALPLFLKTWRATTNIQELATVMRWANGMRVLRWLGKNAAVVARELDIPSATGGGLSDLPTRFRFTLLVFRRRLPGGRGFLIGTSNLNIYGSSADECLSKDASFRLGVNAHTLYGWVFRPLEDARSGNETGVDVTLAGLTTNGHRAYAHNVLMEMITVALLWENAFVGPILRLSPS